MKGGAFVAALALAAACSEPRGSAIDRANVERQLGPLTWSAGQELVADDAAELDEFGRSVSLGTDRAIIGAYGESGARGAAYVYARSGDSWTQEQKLVASDGAALDKFGYAVSITGDRALVGAYGASAYRGAAYVFVRIGGSWVEEQKLVADDGAGGDNFGYAVSLAADRALVGASGSDTGRGAAYVFVRNGGAWVEEQKLAAIDGGQGDSFGYAVSLSGDRAVVGAPGSDGYRGAGRVFVRSGGGWAEEQKLVADDGAAFDNFGTAVAIGGERVLVGAHWNDDFRGAAYTYVRSGGVAAGGWIQEQKLVPSDGAGGERFGGAVSLAADRALIGAAGIGGAYVFARTSGSWSQEKTLVPSGVRSMDLFGWSVALAADRALVGASYTDQLRGAAYVYSLGVETGDAGAADSGPDAGPIDTGGNQPGACARGDECASGHCEDGICCDRTCTASERCSAELKVSGEDGVCGPAAAAAIGAPCRFDVQCTTGRCRGGGDSGVCAQPDPAPDAGCTSGAMCVVDAAGFAPSDDAGCGCRAVSWPGNGLRAWFGLALALLGFRQSRRSRRS